ncbi:MAG: diguanylate cyclase [Planctomycetes bacterium]|nr:diguanylate cyclase [Planctomycetota bacterium]
MAGLHLVLLGMAIGAGIASIAGEVRRLVMRRLLRRSFASTHLFKKITKETVADPALDKAARAKRKPDSRKTDDKSSLEARESKLAEILAELRELMLRLTEIIATTNNATGEVSENFEKAKKTLENLEADPTANLGQLKNVILSEIDKMVKSNEELKQQLQQAQSGINTQKQEIDQLKSKVKVDTLTRLLNRAAFDEVLKSVFIKWRRTREVFSLLMLDVDHFKQINDSYGHIHGDRLLMEIAIKIRENTRDRDFPARYGGEEFAVIFPDTAADEALVIGTRIREAIERTHFQVDHNPIRITISGGIAQSGVCPTPLDLIDVADKALYRSKELGRNRITLGEDKIKESWTSGQGKITIAGLEGGDAVGNAATDGETAS